MYTTNSRLRDLKLSEPHFEVGTLVTVHTITCSINYKDSELKI